MAKKQIVEKTDTSKELERVIYKVEEVNLYRIRQSIASWRNAINEAEGTEKNYQSLIRLYNDITLDTHISALIDSRVSRLLCSDFTIVNASGKQDTVYQEKFDDEWFSNVMRWYVESKFYGYSLIQIDDIVNGNISEVKLIKRENVNPYKREIVGVFNTEGVNYTKPEYYDWLIEINTKDFGYLCKLAPLAIYKKGALSFWNEFAEIFGTPFRVGKTSTNRPEDRKKMADFLKNMGSSGYGVMGKDEEIQFIENSRGDAFGVYENLINKLNSEMSKLVLGGTESIEGGGNGSEARATVHNNQTEYKEYMDKKGFEYFVNKYLIPKLYNLGVVKDTIKFSFNKETSLEELTMKIDIDAKVSSLLVEGQLDKTYLVDRYGVVINNMN